MTHAVAIGQYVIGLVIDMLWAGKRYYSGLQAALPLLSTPAP